MTSFAQVADLEAFTGQTLNAPQAQQVLNQATGIIQAWTGQNLFQVVNDTVTVDPQLDMSVFLPEMPVTAVSSFQWLDDRGGTGWNVIDPSAYRFKSWGKLYIVPQLAYAPPAWGPWAWWPTDPDTIQVTYTHGYAVIPDPIYDVCIALAARLLINPYKLQSSRTGDVQVVYTGAREASELLDTEQVALGRYSIYGNA